MDCRRERRKKKSKLKLTTPETALATATHLGWSNRKKEEEG
jgi:hypothetical protein